MQSLKNGFGKGGMCDKKRGMCDKKGACVARQTATTVDSMHLTGMHSC